MGEPNVMSAISELETYLQNTEKWLGKFKEAVGWTKDDAHELEDKVQCSVCPDHFVPATKLESHIHKCVHASEGYSKEDLEVDQSSDFYYEMATTVVPIKLEPCILANLLSSIRMTNVPEGDLPKTVKRYCQDLTPSERLKVYEYCIETARQVDKMTRISDEELMLLGEDKKRRDAGPKSKLEMMAEERDFKRRRQSYKGKSVHTGKKSHLQVLREVIEGQMDLLKSTMTKDQDTASQSDRADKSDTKYSARSRSRSRDVKQKRKYHRRSRSRSKSRDRERSHSKHRKHKKKKKHKE